ncbi:hypothetical protein GQ53DRAFT_822456 [Thozetella sp. PMI_491]|nr:hypothetical protein GQ53DRAFT_822456 [Thozetella sp. PMI_491]
MAIQFGDELPSNTEVLICGAGPAGLIVAVGLAQQGIDTLLIEKRERSKQITLGRAVTLFPRSLELLEQISVLDAMNQEGSISRAAVSYNGGDRVTERGFQSAFSYMRASYNDYGLNIRQQLSEKIFADEYAKCGKSVMHGWKMDSYELEKRSDDDMNISAKIHHTSGESRTIRCKYVVGADGSQSQVRSSARVAMEGDDTTFKWARFDGKVKTDMPDADLGFITKQTKTHGNVLWLKLDKDANRIGYVLTPALQSKYPDGMSEEAVVQEAINAMKPFSLEVERVDWWTQYNIKQKVAATLQKDYYILLAGDSAHTHSSGFGQGMNTAVHDATNLIWKLAGTLKGWYTTEGVLPTYNAERRQAAMKLIDIDHSVAAIISGSVPQQYGGPDSDPDEALGRVFRENMEFNIGLGVVYTQSSISRKAVRTSVLSGTRAPDALVQHPGARIPRRLQTAVLQASGLGRWSVLVFAGYHHETRAAVVSVREKLGVDGSLGKARGSMLNWATLVMGVLSGNVWDAFGGPAVGRLFFDPEGQAHSQYGVSVQTGAIAVIRPDGVLGFATSLDGLDEVENYFAGFCA